MLSRTMRPPAIFAAARRLSSKAKIVSPPMVYIKGEETTAYCMEVELAAPD